MSTAHDRWLSEPYDNREDVPEPTQIQVDQAFDNLVSGDLKSFCDYTDDRGEDVASLMRIYREWDGIPGRNIGEKMDQSRDAFEAIFKRLDDGYRSVVEENGELDAEAEEIAVTEWEAESADSINASREP